MGCSDSKTTIDVKEDNKDDIKYNNIKLTKTKKKDLSEGSNSSNSDRKNNENSNS